MKVLMIGTPVCPKCKQLAPKLKAYCDEHNIEYEYSNLTDLPSDILELLVAKNVKSAPSFLVYRGEEITIISGDDIFLKLESI